MSKNASQYSMESHYGFHGRGRHLTQIVGATDSRSRCSVRCDLKGWFEVASLKLVREEGLIRFGHAFLG